MATKPQLLRINEPIEDLFGGLEAWCEAFNEFAVIFFGYLKYILAFILLAIGLLTLLKLRGTYIQSRLKNIDKSVVEIDKRDNPHLILGAFSFSRHNRILKFVHVNLIFSF